MDTVEKIKSLCKSKRIAISRLEKDLGFSNGYIGQLRKGQIRADRLFLIAEYLGVSVDDLMNEQQEKPTTDNGSGLNPEYYELTDENRALVDDLIAKLLKSQSAG